MIRVLHVTEDHSARNTGISSAVDGLCRCVPAEIQPSIACAGEETLPPPPGVNLSAFPTRGLGCVWRYAPAGRAGLSKLTGEADVVHLHGLWMWPQWAAAREASKRKVPFGVSAHGMLEPWIWQRQAAPQRLKKYLYWSLVAYPALRRADFIHALTSQEARTLEHYFPGKQAVLIPHGIDLGTVDRQLAAIPPRPGSGPPYILFLGRLHPVKGIHLLLQAFARLPGKELRLRLAGPEQPQEAAYAESLRHLVQELGLESRVEFTGRVEGAAKWQLYRDAWAFCLPSFSEVIGMVNLEAAAAGAPVITTFESGVADEWDQAGGVRVRPQVESILHGLEQALSWSITERDARGKAMRSLIERRYGWEQVGRQWADLYRRAAQGRQHAG